MSVRQAVSDGKLDGNEAAHGSATVGEDWVAWYREFGGDLEHQKAYSDAWREGFAAERARRRRSAHSSSGATP